MELAGWSTFQVGLVLIFRYFIRSLCFFSSRFFYISEVYLFLISWMVVGQSFGSVLRNFSMNILYLNGDSSQVEAVLLCLQEFGFSYAFTFSGFGK